MPHRPLFCRTIAAAVALASVTTPARAQAPDAPAAVIVFDGSGSMWARLDGDSKQAKFYLARDGIKSALAAVKSDVRLGFTSFGHRRQGDCSDVQVSLPPEDQQAGRDKLTSLLDRHNPRGKSPLTTALREAVKALPKGSGPRSLVIVHDDLDNCSQDPCSVLADLRAAQPDLIVHAIGLGLKGEDAQRLQCLVKPTGGRLIDVQAASAVTGATDEILKLATAIVAPMAPAAKPAPPPPAPVASQPARPTATQPVPTPNARRALRKDGPPALRLATLLATGQAPLARDIAWVVRSVDKPDAEAIHAKGQDIAVAVAQGPHTVEVRDGLAPVKILPVNVAPLGETALDVTLDAALVRANFPAIALDAGRIQLFEGDLTNPVAILPASDMAAGLALKPGAWIARLVEGTAARDIPFEARLGATVNLGATWPFASLTVTVAGAAKQSRYPATVIVYEDDPDAPRGRREIARGTSGGTLVVPTGTYAIVVRQGSIEARDHIALQAGATLQRTVTLTAAHVTLTSRLPGASAAADGAEPVAYRLERLDVSPPELFTGNRRVTDLDIPAGRYRIEARHGLVNARASREVTLTPGQVTTITFDQQAGILRLIGPPGVSDLLWELRDDNGHALWSTAQTSPTATLQAGRYIVTFDHRGKRQDWRIDLRAGEVRLLDAKP